MKLSKLSLLIIFFSFVLACCEDEPAPGPGPMVDDGVLSEIEYAPEEYNLVYPDHFPRMVIPEDNPLTIDGVELGRRLFYDPILSIDSTMSCSSCHLQEGSFTDNRKVSIGVDKIAGTRSSMSLLNIGFVTTGLFWDGGVQTLEEQALLPVEDPIELHHLWPDVINQLRSHEDYPMRFRKAFGIDNKSEINRGLAVKAIAQFERTLVSSGNAKYDRIVAGRSVYSDEELRGFDIFFDEHPDPSRHAECGHCHNAPLFTTNEFRNNGLDEVSSLADYIDKGLGETTGRIFDNGMFRIPTLRNIEQTAPYMHDGRFNTLDEVIDHYITGGFHADNLGAVMRPLNLGEEDRQDLIAFIKTLYDPDFLTDPRYSNPF